MSRILRFALTLAAWATACAALPALADPPARVGRLSLLDGNVTFRTDRQDAGAPATVNWPISSGAILDTDRNGRAEIWIGSNTFRLDGGSRAEFTTVDDQRVALQMAQGTLAVTVRDGEQADSIDIATPAGQIRFGAAGRYRIDVDERSGDTQVASRDGVAYMYRPGGELSVPGGQRAVAYAAGGWFVTDNRPDAFDDWADARDSMNHAPAARRYVSPHMTGYEDLDRYGTWSSSPEYGEVWYPSTVPAGWAPYRYGRWAWISPWGWTWIDAAPWGFAPFHYGRWALVGGQWAWVPGSYTARPVYAPALVAWVGEPGWSASFSFGSSPAVGWFPLAPHEVFVPAYRCSPTYVRQVNVTNVRNTTVIEQVVSGRQKPTFVHRSLVQAVTVVPTRTVQSSSPITQGGWRQPERHELAQAPIVPRAPGTAWLPPARTILQAARPDHGPHEGWTPSPHPGEAPPSQTVSPNITPPTAIRSLPLVQPSTPPNESLPGAVRRFGVPREQMQSPSPVPATPQPAAQVYSNTHSIHDAIRALPRIPQTESPAPSPASPPISRPEPTAPAPAQHSIPAAITMQPQAPWRPSPPAMQPPARVEAIQRPLPAPPKVEERPAARQALPRTVIDRIREQGKLQNPP